MKHKIHCIHMIGIGGAGMSGIAEVLLQQGYAVSGSDMAESSTLDLLRGMGAKITIGHSSKNVGNAQVVVKSTAIRDDNPELLEASARKIAVIPRAEMLAELMRLTHGAAIAGTHGKTTTTSLAASIFDAASLDATVIIGGRLNVYGANARLGHGEWLIAEADESDGSFLCLFPVINIVTNIDNDHLDHYGSRDAIDEAFIQFMNKVPFYGANFACSDDPGVRAILPFVKRQVVSYGLGEDASLRGKILRLGEKSEFEVWRDGKLLGVAVLPQPGRHNVQNALGAIGAAMFAGASFEDCVKGLANFKGVGRRFEIKGQREGVLVVDDYGHHPAEIAATLEAVKAVFPGRRIVAAFQPHRFSRTAALFGDFCRVFDSVDELLVTEIYAASEDPLPGVSGESLCKGINQVGAVSAKYCQTLEGLRQELDKILRDGDVLLTIGAGSITQLGPAWLEGRPCLK